MAASEFWKYIEIYLTHNEGLLLLKDIWEHLQKLQKKIQTYDLLKMCVLIN